MYAAVSLAGPRWETAVSSPLLTNVAHDLGALLAAVGVRAPAGVLGDEVVFKIDAPNERDWSPVRTRTVATPSAATPAEGQLEQLATALENLEGQQGRELSLQQIRELALSMPE